MAEPRKYHIYQIVTGNMREQFLEKADRLWVVASDVFWFACFFLRGSSGFACSQRAAVGALPSRLLCKELRAQAGRAAASDPRAVGVCPSPCKAVQGAAGPREVLGWAQTLHIWR